MIISACVIVKNEAKNIVSWLENVKQYADEYIVVDTGSEDETVTLAEAGGAQVYHFPWIGDFAAAKNYALSKAKGQWIAFLDADEIFSPQTVGKVREVVEKAARRPNMGGIVCRLVNIDKDNGNKLIDVVKQLRLFRRLKALQYEGRVHEHLPTKEFNRHIFEYSAELEIYHTGYSASISKLKGQRNREILQRELVTGRKIQYYYKYMMDSYLCTEELDKAYEFGKLAIADKDKPLDSGSEIYTKQCAVMRILKKPQAEIIDVLAEGIKEYPESAALCFMAGVLAMDAFSYNEAERLFLFGLELHEGQQKSANAYEMMMNSGSGEQMLKDVYCFLGDIALLRLDKAKAAEWYLKGIQNYIYSKENLLKLCKLLWTAEPVALIGLLQDLYKDAEAEAWLTECLSQLPPNKVWLFFAQRVAKKQGKQLNSPLAYLVTGKAEAALTGAVEAYENVQRLGAAAARALGVTTDLAGGGLLAACYKAVISGKDKDSIRFKETERIRKSVFAKYGHAE